MVTASHNPPSDNAVKVYWSSGGQVLPPHDQGIIDCVERVRHIMQRLPLKAVARGQIMLCTEEIDQAFVTLVAQGFGGPRDWASWSTRHCTASEPRPSDRLELAGFRHVTLYPPHAEPDGDFPNVPGQVSNPENPRVFDAIIEYARDVGADLVLATDPDCDRMGCAAPRTLRRRG